MYSIKYYDIFGHILYVDLFDDYKSAKKHFRFLNNIDIFDFFDYSKIVLYDLVGFKTLEVLENDFCSKS